VDKYWQGKKTPTLNYVGLNFMLLPEYWGQGLGTEAVKKAIHFTFMGLEAPWLFISHFTAKPEYAKFIKKLGLSHHSTNGKKNSNEQYRYTRADYLNNNNLADENMYDYKAVKSSYNHGKPIRIIDGIKYPDDVHVGLCGQSVIAMLAGLSTAEVAGVMHVDTPGQEVHISYMLYTLDYYGLKKRGTWAKRVPINKDTVLPDICILLMSAPEGWNYFSLYYKGTYYDPKVGVVDKLPADIKPISYIWEIYN